MFFSFFTWSTCLRRITSWRERILRAKKFDEVLCRQRQTRAKVPEKKSSNFLHTLLICPRKMTSANDEFMILTVGWLSTHLYDDKMPLTEFKSGTDSKKVNPGDRILMQPSFQLPSYSMSAAAAELSWTNNAGTNVWDGCKARAHCKARQWCDGNLGGGRWRAGLSHIFHRPQQ